MRSIFSLITLLLALVIVMLLFSRQAKHDVSAVKSVTFVQTTGESPRAYDAPEADRLIARLRSVCDLAELPKDEISEAAKTAASWGAATTPGSAEYHTAVKLRSAANELLASSESPSDAHRAAARRLLDEAANPPGSPGAQPRSAVQGVRDQMETIKNQQREQVQENDPH